MSDDWAVLSALNGNEALSKLLHGIHDLVVLHTIVLHELKYGLNVTFVWGTVTDCII